MGHYTHLRAKFTVKPQWRPVITALHDRQNPDKSWREWGWKTLLPAFPFTSWLHAWSTFDRADSIPFGAGGGMLPPGFTEDGEEQHSIYDPKTGVWDFACCLKNYESEIDSFFKLVVQVIAEKLEYYETISESWRDFIHEPHPFDPDPQIDSWERLLHKWVLNAHLEPTYRDQIRQVVRNSLTQFIGFLNVTPASIAQMTSTACQAAMDYVHSVEIKLPIPMVAIRTAQNDPSCIIPSLLIHTADCDVDLMMPTPEELNEIARNNSATAVPQAGVGTCEYDQPVRTPRTKDGPQGRVLRHPQK